MQTIAHAELAQSQDGSLYISDDSKGAIYKITFSKSMASQNADLSANTTPVKLATPEKSTPGIPADIKASYDAGAAVYTRNCVVCHLADGGGVQNLNAPLVRTDYVLGNKSRLINIILKGMKGVDINGERFNNVMPSHSFLSDTQIADVLTYVRNSFGNKASGITTSEVTAARKAK